METKLIYKHESTLFNISFIISLLFWVALVYLSKGILFLFMFPFFILYLFTQSSFISNFRGNGVMISAEQFPDLDEKIKACAEKLKIKKIPTVYLINGNGVFNAFATQFLRMQYIVLLSSIIDDLQENPDAINFYIGHELGHVCKKHLLWELFFVPSSSLPLLGTAMYRAQEYTADLHGAFCCENTLSAQQAIALLAVGSSRWKDMNMSAYIEQTKDTRSFWMSFHELISSYPWLTKRLTRISPDFPQEKMPRRNPFAYLLAVFIPRSGINTAILIFTLSAFMIPGHIKQERSKEMQHYEEERTEQQYPSSLDPYPSPTYTDKR